MAGGQVLRRKKLALALFDGYQVQSDLPFGLIAITKIDDVTIFTQVSHLTA
jgi:hypothetical protein